MQQNGANRKYNAALKRAISTRIVTQSMMAETCYKYQVPAIITASVSETVGGWCHVVSVIPPSSAPCERS